MPRTAAREPRARRAASGMARGGGDAGDSMYAGRKRSIYGKAGCFQKSAFAGERDGSKRQLAVYPAQPGSDPKTSPTCANAAYHGSPDAPYDQEYYLIINVAVGGSLGGGVLYWGSEAPWRNCSHDKGCDPKTLFQQQQAQWLPTWTRPFEIDWVRVTK